MDKINREMAQKGMLSRHHDNSPADKIASALRDAGARPATEGKVLDDVERAKIKKLTKYYKGLSQLYQKSIAELRGHSMYNPDERPHTTQSGRSVSRTCS